MRPNSSFVDDYLAALLAQASHLISNEFHLIVNQNGFSISEWRVLASLYDNPNLSIGRLSEITLSKQPTITRLLNRMSNKGFVIKVDHPSDKRVTLVRITPMGEKIVKKLIDLAKDHERKVLSPFGKEHSEALKEALRQMILIRQTHS
jgi:DNA-binding MarR family transcriptional regulator